MKYLRLNLRGWIWLPLLLVVSLRWSVAGSLTLAAAELAVPVAAFLGYRFGHRGIWITALGGLLLPVGFRFQALASVPRLDIYLAALLVCFLAASSKPLRLWLARWRASPCFFLAFLLLPLAVGLLGGEFGSLVLFLALRFSALFFLFAFLAGVSPISGRLFVMTLAGFTLAGMLLEAVGLPQDGREFFGGPKAELPLVGMMDLRYLWATYGLNSPASWLAGIGYFHAGRMLRRMLAGGFSERPGPAVWGAVLLLALVGVGGELNRFAAQALAGANVSSFMLVLGSFYALIGAALLGGLLLRWCGVMAVFSLVMLFWGVDAALRSGLDFSQVRLWMPLEEPLAVLGFGMLGIALRHLALHIDTPWWSPRWTGFALLLALLTASFIAEAQGFWDVVWAVLVFFGSLGLALVLAWLRERLLGWLPRHGGWSALANLLLLTLLARQMPGFWSQGGGAVREVGTAGLALIKAQGIADLGMETLVIFCFFMLFGFLWVSALQALVRDLRHCWSDVRTLARFAGLHLKGAAPGNGGVAGEVQGSSSAPKGEALYLRALQMFRRVMLVFAFAPLLVATVVDLYPPGGFISHLREWTAGTERKFDDGADPGERVRSRSPPANTFLYQAAREFVDGLPVIVDDPLAGLVVTDWYDLSVEPRVRERIAIRIGPDLAFYALNVDLRRQHRGTFGLWVEQGTYWDARRGEFVGVDLFPVQKALEEKVLKRAEELAQAVD